MVCPGAAGLFDQPGTAAAAQQCWPHTGPPPRSKPGGGSVARCGGAQLQGGTACAAPPPALHCQGSAEAALQASGLGTAPSADAMPGRACELRPHSILSSSLPEHLPHSGVKSRLLPLPMAIWPGTNCVLPRFHLQVVVAPWSMVCERSCECSMEGIWRPLMRWAAGRRGCAAAVR